MYIPYWDELDLPPFNVSKSRSQPSPVAEYRNYDDDLIIEMKSDPEKLPATYDCSFICRSSIQLSVIGSLFQHIALNTNMTFYKDLKTEYGTEKHLVQITGGIPQPDPGNTGRNDMPGFSFKIYVKEMIKPTLE